MSKDFSYLRHWITREGYGPGFPGRAVILECIASRSGMSMTVYDRGERLYAVPSAAFGGGLSQALGHFLQELFQPELMAFIGNASEIVPFGRQWNGHFGVDRRQGIESILVLARAIGLKVHQSESKAGTLIIIEKGS